MVGFSGLFENDKPVIGMIHLAGRDSDEVLEKAIIELSLYEKEGVDGAIIEDYHGTPQEVERVLRETQSRFKLVRGVNVLRDPYSGFSLAEKYGARFVQFDSVQAQDVDVERLDSLRRNYLDIVVLGGVGFKYTQPTGNPVETDLNQAILRCEAVVTTGTGTGVETPLEKLRTYKEILRDFPLVVGAGVNADNVRAQLEVGDGAIVGSYFKDGDTTRPIIRDRVRRLMDIVEGIRC